MALEIGSVVGGKYEILKVIGRGGMSVVYLAMDKNLNKQWAVKEVKRVANDAKNDVVVNSLLAEANLMKKLDHPNLPRIVDIIETGETLFVVMDYIEGESLEKIVQLYGPQPEEVVIDWAKQLCMVLGYLHNQNPPIIYRDMKPANVMLKPEGTLKVIDFGIAREYKIDSLKDTTNLGTRGYAAPEQYEGKGQTDQRTDIYCLGVTLHHLLTGKYPEEYPYELIPITEFNPMLSGGLERIIMNCTQRNPENRYQNCDELLYDLEHYEEVDEVYRTKQKNKLKGFIVTASLCLITAVCGVAGLVMANNETNQLYESKINIASSTDYDTKVQSHKDAIGPIGNDVRAYQKLLQAYQQNGVFGDKESNEFTALYNQNSGKLKENIEDYLSLNYDIGTLYFYFYSGGDNTFRTRVLKSYPYFSNVVNSEDDNFDKKDIAESYYIIGEFYSDFVESSTGVNEVTKESFEQLLDSFMVCIENVSNYESSDSAYTSLTMFQEIANMINERRKEFAATGVSKDELFDVLDIVQSKTEELVVTRDVSVELREEILKNCEEFKENIERTYTNLGEAE